MSTVWSDASEGHHRVGAHGKIYPRRDDAIGALSLIPGIGPVLDGIFETLKGSGVIRTPEDELKAQQALASIDAARFDSYVKFIQATTPASAYTPRWINGFIAITRPAIVWLVTSSIIIAFFTPGVAERIVTTLRAFGDAGPAGWAFIGIPLAWMTGRTLEKRWGVAQGAGNGEVRPPEVLGHQGSSRARERP